MNWTVLLALFWMLTAIAAWIFHRPSDTEREVLEKVTTMQLLFSSWEARRRLGIPADEEQILKSYRQRLLSSAAVVALPALILVVLSLTDQAPAEPPVLEPAAQRERAEVPAEEPRDVKQLIRTYVRETDEEGPPVVVEEYREETLEEKRDPIRLYGTAKVAPLYDNEQLLGITITNVQPNSFWEMVGFEEGDFVLEANGERMDNPNTSVAFMNSLHDAPEVVVRVRGTDGAERTLLYNAPKE